MYACGAVITWGYYTCDICHTYSIPSADIGHAIHGVA